MVLCPLLREFVDLELDEALSERWELREESGCEDAFNSYLFALGISGVPFTGRISSSVPPLNPGVSVLLLILAMSESVLLKELLWLPVPSDSDDAGPDDLNDFGNFSSDSTVEGCCCAPLLSSSCATLSLFEVPSLSGTFLKFRCVCLSVLSLWRARTSSLLSWSPFCHFSNASNPCRRRSSNTSPLSCRRKRSSSSSISPEHKLASSVSSNGGRETSEPKSLSRSKDDSDTLVSNG